MQKVQMKHERGGKRYDRMISTGKGNEHTAMEEDRKQHRERQQNIMTEIES